MIPSLLLYIEYDDCIKGSSAVARTATFFSVLRVCVQLYFQNKGLLLLFYVS